MEILPVLTFSILALMFSKRILAERAEQQMSRKEKIANAIRLLTEED